MINKYVIRPVVIVAGQAIKTIGESNQVIEGKGAARSKGLLINNNQVEGDMSGESTISKFEQALGHGDCIQMHAVCDCFGMSEVLIDAENEVGARLMIQFISTWKYSLELPVLSRRCDIEDFANISPEEVLFENIPWAFSVLSKLVSKKLVDKGVGDSIAEYVLVELKIRNEEGRGAGALRWANSVFVELAYQKNLLDKKTAGKIVDEVFALLGEVDREDCDEWYKSRVEAWFVFRGLVENQLIDRDAINERWQRFIL